MIASSALELSVGLSDAMSRRLRKFWRGERLPCSDKDEQLDNGHTGSGQRGSKKTITEGKATLYLAAVDTQLRMKFVVGQDKRNTIYVTLLM